MRLVIEVTNESIRLAPEMCDGHEDIWGIATRVTFDDKRQYGLERKMREDELRSHFDIIWEEMGIQIKAGMKEPVGA